MRYVASCSFGKDSVATVILAKMHNEPLDEVVYCEVMFDEHTSAEVPEHAKFIHEVAIPTFESWGIKVTILRAENKNFIERFNHLVGKGPHTGKRWAWPLCNRCYVQRDLKVRPIERWKRSIDKNTVQYLGIASDEQERLMRLDGVRKISLLNKYGLSEDDAKQLCKDWGLLSPVYEFTDRGGCFFCPNAKEPELRHLCKHHPALWLSLILLQALPNKTTDRWNRTETFFDVDARIRCGGKATRSCGRCNRRNTNETH